MRSQDNNEPWPIALTKCYYCGESNAILIGKNTGTVARRQAERANGAVLDMHPCAKCEEWMKQGIILITIDQSKTAFSEDGSIKVEKGELPNPYRTGGFFVIKDDALVRIFGDDNEVAQFGLTNRWMFIEHQAAVAIGLFDANDKAKKPEQAEQVEVEKDAENKQEKDQAE